MWRTVLRNNIQRLRRALTAETSEEKQATLQRMLDEAEAEFSALEDASTNQLTRGNPALRLFAETAIEDGMRLHGAQFGNIQIYDASSGTLTILAQRNFTRPFLDHFAQVTAEDGSACGRCAGGSERVVIENVAEDPSFAPHREVARLIGFQAVQSTPLRDASGKLLGVFSTHCAEPRRFSAEEVAAMDRHAADVARGLARQLQL